jgi:hypothetical protein
MTVTLTFPLIREKQMEDSFYSNIISALKSKNFSKLTRGYYYNTESELLYKQLFVKERERNLLVFPISLIHHLLFLIHTDISGGHAGINRTYQFIKNRFYVKDLMNHVQNYIDHCQTCQYFREKTTYKNEGYMVNIFPKNWEILSKLFVDFMGPFKSSSNGYKYIFVMVDQVSRAIQAYPTKTCTAEATAEAIQKYIWTFGCPLQIVSDNATSFKNSLYQELLKISGAKCTYTSPYRPQSNITERLNKVIIHHMRNFISPSQKDWDLYVGPSVLSYNAKFQKSLKFSPFEILYGKQCILPGLAQITTLENISLEGYQKRLLKIRAAARQNLTLSLQQNKCYVDKHRKPAHNYKPGDLCMVSVPRRTFRHKKYGLINKKFQSPNQGPWEILHKVSPITYRLKLLNPKSAGSKRFISAHVTRMKPIPDDSFQ